MPLYPRPTLLCLADLRFRLATTEEQQALHDGGSRNPDLVYNDTLLGELTHPLLAYARDVWPGKSRTKRILGIDDTVLLQCKENQRWRGAVHVDGDQPWLVAAGWREDGSPDDFYERLVSKCEAERKRLNRAGLKLRQGKAAYSEHLLPTKADRDRLAMEEVAAAAESSRRSVPGLVARAFAQPGVVCEGDAFGAHLRAVCQLGDQVDEMHLAIYVMGGGRHDVDYVILDLAIPGVGVEDWEWRDQDVFPVRPLPGERYWYVFLEAR